MKYYFFLPLIILTACNTAENNSRLPDGSLLNRRNIKKENILYQFEEKFGFTDLCNHSRIYYIVDSFVATEEWKPLPISGTDLEKINAIENKVDTVSGKTLVVKYKYKQFFSDISLACEEFIRDDSSDLNIDLSKGYYRTGKGNFEIYNSGKNAIYYESHRCGEAR